MLQHCSTRGRQNKNVTFNISVTSNLGKCHSLKHKLFFINKVWSESRTKCIPDHLHQQESCVAFSKILVVHFCDWNVEQDGEYKQDLTNVNILYIISKSEDHCSNKGDNKCKECIFMCLLSTEICFSNLVTQFYF